jgi:hypothetical protein
MVILMLKDYNLPDDILNESKLLKKEYRKLLDNIYEKQFVDIIQIECQYSLAVDDITNKVIFSDYDYDGIQEALKRTSSYKENMKTCQKMLDDFWKKTKKFIAQNDLDENATQDQRVGARIRRDAHEFGTTTGRPRDINFLDLEFMRYNARMSGIEVLAATHLDIARADEPIKVCTHYTKDGKVVPYQPGLAYQEGVTPHYIELPGWDGKACSKARTMEDLPDNALRFLAFIQARTGLPFVAATTGAKRDSMVKFPGYSV